MKKALIFFIVGIVFFGSCSAQSANAQNANNERRVIGTWDQIVTYRDSAQTWVFNANGTVTINSNNHKYAVTDTRLVIAYIDSDGDISRISFYSYSISSDGKALLIGDSIWLNKR